MSFSEETSHPLNKEKHASVWDEAVNHLLIGLAITHGAAGEFPIVEEWRDTVYQFLEENT